MRRFLIHNVRDAWDSKIIDQNNERSYFFIFNSWRLCGSLYHFLHAIYFIFVFISSVNFSKIPSSTFSTMVDASKSSKRKSTEASPMLRDLQMGVNTNCIFVKVDRIIRIMTVLYLLGPDRPMSEGEAIHLIVFDASVSLIYMDISYYIN